MTYYYILTIVPLYLITNFIYKKFFINGEYKIPVGEYEIRRIKYNFDEKTINELKEVVMNSVNIIPNNPFFKGEKLQNKIGLIIYHKNKPVGFNVMFDYKYKNFNCLHVGLVLVDKNYRGKRIQNLTKYNVILYLIENLFTNIYLTDLGHSASGLKNFNLGAKNSYPNLIYNTKLNDDYRQIFNYFLDNFKEDTQVSTIAEGNDETFIITKSNNIQGGANYLLEFEDTRMSKDTRYNDYMKKLNIEDEVLSIGKVNLLTVIF